MTVALYGTVTYNGNLPANGKAVAAYNAPNFVQNPQNLSPTPQQAAIATATTDASGHFELTGLVSTTNYWIMVTDTDGNHWFFIQSSQLANTSATRVPMSYVIAAAQLGLPYVGPLAVWGAPG
jgi:hypothetical protein